MSAGEDALFGADEVADAIIGPTEKAVRKALTAAALDDRDHGTAELAAQMARAVDVASRVRRDPYAVAAAGRELAQVLTRLRLDPASRLGGDAGEVAEFLAGLGAT
ncbi:hypothetical protein [Pimelobacter simplex]|uniref:hypothetical protein n=1 Tax=Nocardioides simplex TaxID=2045 RepID=UPI0021503B80|nr:hypothetical protein [Pimelobacter simplex]UUW92678.1 hypothetical protein M0M43_14700 [Pimelobacter simplex]UUW96506.1 hypothetical protein M0M48_03335 [Pimelobacter simplex]